MEKGNEIPKYKFSNSSKFGTETGNVEPETSTKTSKKPKKKTQEVAEARSKSSLLAGTYIVDMVSVNMRYVPGSDSPDTVVKSLKKGDAVESDGYFTMTDSKKWVLVKHEGDAGYIIIDFLKKKK